jgi:3-methyladenine DNA glycosylase AlkC
VGQGAGIDLEIPIAATARNGHMLRAMAEPFKNLFNAEVVRAIGHHLQRVDPGLDRRGFEARALAGLDALELKARVLQVADALVTVLPTDVDRAAGLLEASLGPPGEGDDLGALRTSERGLGGWAVWPLTEAIARLAIDAPERGLAALHAMTQRMTAEFAIRPFIVRHPALSFATLTRWVADPSAHVRRLVSEGSRPRLPWGLRLQALVQDPSPTLPLLAALQDDPSEYVRLSVANHLNDIARDHPARIGEWLVRHLPGASAERRALLRHASRTLIKQGDAAVLAAWGLGQAFRGEARWAVAPSRVAVGGDLTLKLLLRSTSPRPQRLVIDYAVHHVKANGSTSPKVFKGWTLELGPREERALERRHSFKPITTRTYHPGAHTVDLRINGKLLGEATFQLRAG